MNRKTENKLSSLRKLKEEGKLIVLSGPSGCGKTTLCAHLLKRKPQLARSVSATTRLPRVDERRNADYIFMQEAQFKCAIKSNQLLEYAKVFGKHYGTPKKPVLEMLGKGKDVVLCIDVQGAMQIRKAFSRAILVFIIPPTFGDLKKRLTKRSSDTKEEIDKRLKVAHTELGYVSKYDYLVVNDKIARATKTLESIIEAEHRRI